MSALLSARTAEHYTTTMHHTVAELARRFRDTTRPTSGASLPELAALVDAIDLDGPPVGTTEALAEVDALFTEHAVWFHHPGYLAHLNCPVAIPAVATEAILAAVNPSVDTYDQSRVGTLIERQLIDWTAGRIGFGPGADGVFTSGGTQSNLQGLLLAREAALGRLRGAARSVALTRLAVLVSPSAHFSVDKATRVLGLADDALVLVAVDAEGRLRPDALAAALAALDDLGKIPMAVVATAGTTDRGCIDPLAALADVCADAGVWFHVDAAYGCGLLVSPTRRHLLDGIERAHSVTVDFHKAFFQPVSSSAILVRDRAHLLPVAWHADYLNPENEDEPNQVDKSLQTTRRLDALKLWTTLRALGADGVGGLVDTVCDLTARVHDAVDADDDLVRISRTDLSTVLFRYQPAGLSDAEADRLVPLVRRVLFESGRAVVARTVIDGRPCLKLTLLNPDLTLEDVLAVLALVRSTAAFLTETAPLAATQAAAL